ncbi:uncharacterized protein LOC121054538 [Oryza brachyantha]|uniref:uncharacterized protein LOC121054538 n=1 Tax=Oryza brachyantha TaxID=4533 RepID=UPI001ADA0618|nr:uncharacterized protein LOC121054538 [Oryza brachyantha]
MEGLIPLLYRAIKDRRSGRGGEPLPGGAGVDLYDAEQRRLWLEQEVRSPLHPSAAASSSASALGQRQQEQHRRNRSLEELAGEVGLSSDRRLRVALPKARSVRVFSCIGAGAA